MSESAFDNSIERSQRKKNQRSIIMQPSPSYSSALLLNNSNSSNSNSNQAGGGGGDDLMQRLKKFLPKLKQANDALIIPDNNNEKDRPEVMKGHDGQRLDRDLVVVDEDEDDEDEEDNDAIEKDSSPMIQLEFSLRPEKDPLVKSLLSTSRPDDDDDDSSSSSSQERDQEQKQQHKSTFDHLAMMKDVRTSTSSGIRKRAAPSRNDDVGRNRDQASRLLLDPSSSTHSTENEKQRTITVVDVNLNGSKEDDVDEDANNSNNKKVRPQKKRKVLIEELS